MQGPIQCACQRRASKRFVILQGARQTRVWRPLVFALQSLWGGGPHRLTVCVRKPCVPRACGAHGRGFRLRRSALKGCALQKTRGRRFCAPRGQNQIWAAVHAPRGKGALAAFMEGGGAFPLHNGRPDPLGTDVRWEGGVFPGIGLPAVVASPLRGLWSGPYRRAARRTALATPSRWGPAVRA